MGTLLFLLAAAVTVAAGQAVERQHVLTIKAPDIDGGILAEITWDNDALMLQGVVANPDGSLSGRYLLMPAKSTKLERRTEHTDASLQYWEKKSKRLSPTGIGAITSIADSKMPMYGIASLERRMGDANGMGGMRQKWIVRLSKLIIQDGGRRWGISVVLVPLEFRSTR